MTQWEQNDIDVIYKVRNNKLRKGLTDAFFSESFEEFGQINATLAKKKSFLTRVCRLKDILKFQLSSHLYLNVRYSITHTDREVNLQNQSNNYVLAV